MMRRASAPTEYWESSHLVEGGSGIIALCCRWTRGRTDERNGQTEGSQRKREPWEYDQRIRERKFYRRLSVRTAFRAGEIVRSADEDVQK